MNAAVVFHAIGVGSLGAASLTALTSFVFLARAIVTKCARRRAILAQRSAVEIEGSVCPSEDGLVTAPVTGRRVVAYRLHVRDGSRVVYTETVTNAFFVATSSGASVLVRPRADFRGTTTEATAPAALLASRRLAPRRATCIEEIIADGDEIAAAGPLRHEPDPSDLRGYRAVPRLRAVLRACGAERLCVTTRPRSFFEDRDYVLRWAAAAAVALASTLTCAAFLLLGG